MLSGTIMPQASRFYGCDYIGAPGVPAQRADIADAVAILKPKPSPYRFVRIGGDADGGYLLPDDLAGISACFSPGVNNFKNFEDELAIGYGIRSHMCDFTSDASDLKTPLIAGMQTFDKKWLDLPGTEDSVQLGDWVDGLYPDPKDDLILQIDIEGAEYRNIITASDATLRRFRVIVMEMHKLRSLTDHNVLSQIVLPFLRKLDASFVCIHAHPNNCSVDIDLPGLDISVPNVIELTFLRRDRFADVPEDRRIAPLLPHPLDVIKNVPHKPFRYMHANWLDGPRPIESRLIIAEQELEESRQEVAQAKHEAKAARGRLEIMKRMRSLDQADRRARVPEKDLEEIAAGRPFVLSSARTGEPVHGNVRSDQRPFFFHTDLGSKQAITIELEAEREVCLVEITNRRDACFDRARDLVIILHVDPDPVSGEFFLVNEPDGFSNGEAIEAATYLPSIPARFVTIRSPGRSYFHLARIAVFAEKARTADDQRHPRMENSLVS